MDEGTLPFRMDIAPDGQLDTSELKKKSIRKVQVQPKDAKKALPFDKIIRRPNSEKTPLIQRGGKSSIASWVINYFPPNHSVFVDVFGGGAAISLAKTPSQVDVYNDIGDVSRFFEVLRDYGNEVYSFLSFYPFSREAFHYAFKHKKVMEATVFPSWDVPGYEQVNAHYKIRWACYYYIVVLQSFRHEEEDDSWIVSKGVNLASSFASHVDAFPETIDRLRNVVIERKDCLELIEQYDIPGTLFYCDPPYLPETWNTTSGYKHMMTLEQHCQLLCMLQKIQGQAVVSGYPSALYDEYLNADYGWIKVEKTRLQGIKNTSQEGSDRTEVLWIKRHHNDLWTQTPIPGILSEETDI